MFQLSIVAWFISIVFGIKQSSAYFFYKVESHTKDNISIHNILSINSIFLKQLELFG